eukprot:TRINITY_DN76165_c0_g1_i2.p1 TRINITY_DN76165_c0_g1~~TRINITY_DN76165_c0_g1_i2.p1  ORF type:complete len:155 (-),score=21.89 TRINITY_DN76165_c0_g1_i2:60-524(-)
MSSLVLSAARSTSFALRRLAKPPPATALLRCRSLSAGAGEPAVLVKDDLLEDGSKSGVKVVTLNRPEKLNPMTVEMGDALQAVVADLESLPANGPDSLRAVVITGAGRAFSAGGDLGFLDDRRRANPTDNAATMRAFYSRFLSVRRLPVPVTVH